MTCSPMSNVNCVPASFSDFGVSLTLKPNNPGFYSCTTPSDLSNPAHCLLRIWPFVIWSVPATMCVGTSYSKAAHLYLTLPFSELLTVQPLKGIPLAALEAGEDHAPHTKTRRRSVTPTLHRGQVGWAHPCNSVLVHSLHRLWPHGTRAK